MIYGNEPTTEPDLAGVGRAWKLDLDLYRDGPNMMPDHEGTVAWWLVHAPGAHPFWSWYVVGTVHLREIEGQTRRPHLQFPGASHEILFVALNPEHPLPSLDAWADIQFLEPLDLVEQFIVSDDDAAAELTELVVKHIVDGMSPDQDHRQYWAGAIARTAEHIRLGGHPDAA